MIGIHAVPVVVDAYMKGLTDVPEDQLLDALVSTATAPGAHKMKFREYPQWYGQKHYVRLGYFPDELVRSGASLTLEHAYDDWAIGHFADTIGNDSVAEEYRKRGQNYRNVWDPETEFFRAKMSDGSWHPFFDPRAYHREDHKDREYTEGNAWQYLFFAPHDVYGMIDLFGGEDAFKSRLDMLFSLEPEKDAPEVKDVSGLIGDYAHGNEPCHHVAYLYNYVGESWKTQERIREIADLFYHPTPEGLIGNEDAGQMSAWYVMSSFGFYPVNPAGGIYVIGTPLLPEMTLNLENGNQFEIKAKNYGADRPYIQSVKLNGKPLERVWIQHSDITAGGVLEFTMGAEPSEWGANSPKVPLADGKTSS